MSISTHVLDAVAGRPAAGVAVQLHRSDPDGWTPLAVGYTDGDGRIADFGAPVQVGVYRLTFASEEYFDVETFYPAVSVTFRVSDPTRHLHVPLLLSPFAYSTYRGT